MKTSNMKHPDEHEVFNTDNAALPRERIDISISWHEDVDATLIELLDNDDTVQLPKAGVTGRGNVSVSYRARAAATHVIRWTLSFAGGTLTNLAAKGRRDTGSWSDLRKPEKKVERMWRSRGDL